MASSGLYRSNRHSMIAGVMGGIAERFGWNVTLLRVIFVLISIMSAAFPGILVYLVLWLVIPKKQPEYIEGYRQSVRTVNEEQVR
ncbi:PspC domain-containing protein [Acinetobacter pittii]|uniref:PspC domain-containing protein n=1 Tax=Acinetobacter pittii TaxID=48296 RepID=UPI0026F188EE|nr:PspC domain-containing protein [Acinetobacter pittii]MDO7198032.1 PspC domain-containing protein [Acinetobacter pittii]